MMFLLFLYAITICSVIGITGASDCPRGWLDNSDNCYLFRRKVATWESARQRCMKQDADLLYITDPTEKNWLPQQIQNYYTKYNVAGWWTGLHDPSKSQTFVWSTGSTDMSIIGQNGKDPNGMWQVNEPNNHNNNEYCGEIDQNGKLNDNNCDNGFSYICKRKKNAPKHCDFANGWQIYDDRCYKYSMESKGTWDSAKAQCQTENANLVSILNYNDETAVHDIVYGSNSNVWIGLNYTSTSKVWVSGESLDNTNVYWIDGQPGTDKTKNCVYLTSDASNENKTWVTSECSAFNRFICQKSLGACDDGWQTYKDQCYMLHATTGELASWSDAHTFCKDRNADHLIIKSNDQQKFIINNILNRIGDSVRYTDIWLGIHTNVNGKAQWVDGSPLAATFWLDGQPAYVSNDLCGQMDIDNGGWSLRPDCYVSQPFVCQIPSYKSPVYKPTPPLEYSCDSGWEVFPDHAACFLFNTTSVTQSQAQRFCQKRGSRLATIRNEDTMTFIAAKIPSPMWIGLHRIEDDQGNQIWTWNYEEQAAVYTNWDDNEQNVPDDENCVDVFGPGSKIGRWNHLNCTEKVGFICEKPAVRIAVLPTPVITTTECGSGWETAPHHEQYCYQFNIQQSAKWNDARRNCLNAGGDLLTILDPSEQIYIAGRMRGLPNLWLWTALYNMAFSKQFLKFSWVNSSPMAYFNYETGQPSIKSSGYSCGAISPSSSKWKIFDCESQLGYVCKKSSSVPKTTVPPPTLPTTSTGNMLGCPKAWSRYSKNQCIQINSKALTWESAQAECVKSGGNLLTIEDRFKKTFIQDLIMSSGSQYWIGLNAKDDPQYFQWVDGSDISYTEWMTNEPQFILDEPNCVVMKKYSDFSVRDCSSSSANVGYICQTGLQLVSIQTTPSTLTGCPAMLYRHKWGKSCYGVNSDKFTFNDAEGYCRKNGGHLVKIKDRMENTFVGSLIRDDVISYWIGFTNDRKYTSWTSNTYKWTDGSRATHTYWDVSHDGSNKPMCAVIQSEPIKQNLWADRMCTKTAPFICEAPDSDYTTPAPTTHPRENCPRAWKYFDGMCYKAFTTDLQNWDDAENFCFSNYGGHLISLHGNAQFTTFFRDLVPNSSGSNYWIGGNSKDPQFNNTWQWSDGSSWDYTNWQSGEPNSFNNQEECLEMYGNSMKWNDINCHTSRYYICGVAPGTKPPVTQVPPTGDTSPTCHSKDASVKWIHFDGMCYYATTSYGSSRRTTWTKAEDLCNGYGGHLTSIDSQTELNFVLGMIGKLTSGSSKYWVGLSYRDGPGRWSDKLPLLYTNWDRRQPSSTSSSQCVRMSKTLGVWSTASCTYTGNFICKKTNDSFATILPPTEPPIVGNCPTDFVPIGNKCIKVLSELKTWANARKKCGTFGTKYDLMVIESDYEQSLVTTLLVNLTANAWIGMSDNRKKYTYSWINYKRTRVTYWQKSQPTRSGIKYDTYACAEMVSSPVGAGLWRLKTCTDLNGFVCSGLKDPSLPTPKPTSSTCKNGYSRYRQSCYKVIVQKMNWEQANRHCSDKEAPKAELVSITDQFEQTYVHYISEIMNVTSFWIGLNARMGLDRLGWIDGWPFIYKNWGTNEPSSRTDWKCVSMMANGKWNKTDCNQKFPFVCKTTEATKPSVAPVHPDRCKYPWIYHNNMCYYFSNSSTKAIAYASFLCQMNHGAELASIHSQEVTNFFVNVFKSVKRSYNYWIGLAKEKDGPWTWLDDTKIDYKNWASGEPNKSQSSSKACGSMAQSSGQWYPESCTTYRLYICQKPAIQLTSLPTPVTKATTPKPIKTTTKRATVGPTNGPVAGGQTQDVRKETGMIVGICVGMIMLVAVIVGIVIFLRRRQIAGPDAVGFNNALYSRTEDTVDLTQVEQPPAMDDRGMLNLGYLSAGIDSTT
ncbi:macrophage mannose receptor 1-like isoform X2 [Tubulanus polymorphus]|uniref:macrophage mannose receptor 1-like isoform X2 n=1 Tax=Tubulanus polymorphus TaxID=672921 RepID=UPI003DA5928A